MPQYVIDKVASGYIAEKNLVDLIWRIFGLTAVEAELKVGNDSPQRKPLTGEQMPNDRWVYTAERALKESEIRFVDLSDR